MSSSGHAGGNVPIRPETTVERVSPREVVVTRTFDAPARLVFAAWTRAELFERWWVPRSLGMKLLSCELDVRPGGSYRLVLDQGDAEPIAFFGTYLEVVPDARLVWTNEEGGEPGPVTTVTFEEQDGRTLLVMRERHSSKESLEESGLGAAEATVESFAQLDEVVAELVTGATRP